MFCQNRTVQNIFFGAERSVLTEHLDPMFPRTLHDKLEKNPDPEIGMTIHFAKNNFYIQVDMIEMQNVTPESNSGSLSWYEIKILMPWIQSSTK